jgi:alpha-amylase
VNKDFWPPFQEAAGVFTMGEVFNQADDPPNSTCDWAVDALDTVLNYPAWWSVVGTLANVSNPMGGLGYVVDRIATGCHDSTLLGTFSENHDVPRFGSATKDLSQQKNALTFNLMTDGIPVVYYGAEQRLEGKNDPENREALWLAPNGYDTTAPLYQHVKALNIVRTAVGSELAGLDYSNWSGFWAYKAKILYSTDDILVFRKGYDTSIVTALTNGGEGAPDVGPYHMGDTNLVEGTTIVEVLSCNSTMVGLYGEFDITLKNGEPQVSTLSLSLPVLSYHDPSSLPRLGRG